ncbi:MAG: TolC family protein [Ignavibacteria bacterium]|nr:TolC family protein [Ignavibacteria bacterium]
MKRLLVILAAMLAVLPAELLSQSRRIGIDECVKLSLQNSDEIRISRSKVRESESKITEVSSQMLPQLKFSAGYTRLSSVDPFLVTVPFSPVPVKIADAVLNNYTLRLSASQVVFSGFRLASLKSIAEYGSRISSVDYDESKNNAAFEALTAYWNLYKAMLGRQIAEQTVMQTERRITETKNFLLSGLATSTDLLRLEVQNSNAKLQLLEAENAMSNARIALNRIIGYPAESPTEPDTASAFPEETLSPESYYVEYAIENRNELKSLKFAIESSRENIRASKSLYYPYVSLFGNVYYANPNQRIQPPVDKFNATWDVGIGLTWDLWNWGFTSSLTEQARQTEQQNISRLDLARKKIEQEVRQKYLNAEYQKKRMETSELSVRLAQQSYDEILKKYDVQLSTSTELADAETSLFIARRNYAFAMIDLRLSLIALKKSCGIILY